MKDLQDIFKANDGSLPDIEFNFNGETVVSEAYLFIQSKASKLVSTNAYYWSLSKQVECPIKFGDNPAVKYISGEAEPFHVVFGGLKSNTGYPIPDLGFFILGTDFVSIDYRMGPEWDKQAIEGLLEIMLGLYSLAKTVDVKHSGNFFDTDNILLTTFNEYKMLT